MSSSGITDAGITGWGWLPNSPDPLSRPVRITRVCLRESLAPADDLPEDPPPLPPTPELQRLLEFFFKRQHINVFESFKDIFEFHCHLHIIYTTFITQFIQSKVMQQITPFHILQNILSTICKIPLEQNLNQAFPWIQVIFFNCGFSTYYYSIQFLMVFFKELLSLHMSKQIFCISKSPQNMNVTQQIIRIWLLELNSILSAKRIAILDCLWLTHLMRIARSINCLRNIYSMKSRICSS